MLEQQPPAQQQLVSERIAKSIALRNKVDKIRAQEGAIAQIMQRLTLGRTDGRAEVEGTLAGMKHLHALDHQKSLNFLCKTEQGSSTTENDQGKRKVHRFKLDEQTDLWAKPDPVGLGHNDPATAYISLKYCVS